MVVTSLLFILVSNDTPSFFLPLCADQEQLLMMDLLQRALSAKLHPHIASDGPPKGLVVHGSRDRYTPVPINSWRTFDLRGKGKTTLVRAFRFNGWKSVEDVKTSHIFWRSYSTKKSTKFLEKGKPWQRFNRVPGVVPMNEKDTFAEGFRNHKRENSDFRDYFLPKTYRISQDAEDRAAFQKDVLREGGIERPWVLKIPTMNNGKGITMLPPRSKELHNLASKKTGSSSTGSREIVQEYICNELAWFQGEKFDLRFYWLIASVDPLIALYHDGFARVGGAAYNESDWSSTSRHLTNHAFRTADQSDVTVEAVWKRIRQHYQSNKESLEKRVGRGVDPVTHVRNQMKEAIGATAAAFKTNLTDLSRHGNASVTIQMENVFNLLGADFVIDNDLDVWYVEAQQSPGMGESYDYRVEMFRDIFRPVVSIVEEIQTKQIANPKANLLPLERVGKYEVVYAGDWQYKYNGYRGRDRATKLGCELP